MKKLIKSLPIALLLTVAACKGQVVEQPVEDHKVLLDKMVETSESSDVSSSGSSSDTDSVKGASSDTDTDTDSK